MELKDIKPGDLFATPPSSWWTKWLCSIVKAETFHWGMVIDEDEEGWIITESIGKGTALTKFDYERAYIYRIKDLEVEPKRLISIVATYGAYQYDWDVPFKTGIWWLLKHYFGIIIPRWHDKEVNCQEWICLIANELGFKIIPNTDYLMCSNLEHSPHLELLGEIANELH